MPFDRTGVMLTRWINSKKLHRLHSTRYESICAKQSHASVQSAKIRKQFKEDPDAWLLVDKILQDATYPQTKCLLPLSRQAVRHEAADKLQT